MGSIVAITVIGQHDGVKMRNVKLVGKKLVLDIVRINVIEIFGIKMIIT